ncbi:MAG: 16S rRNA (cytosine(967)-C(5))-methyltransferase RsmB [Burkholderiales bacterium]|nr:16S rRNA (cytosine(967)-C(5))-methyltransferase RsmB [Burkholderiales bacterium]
MQSVISFSGTVVQSSQILAARAVQQVLRGAALPAALAENDGALTPAVRGFVHELAYGTLRHWGTLHALFQALSARPAGDPLLPSLVAVALYQLLHTRQPPFAVVDQAVQAAAMAVHPSTKGFVNALLRRFLREKEVLLARIADDPAARYSYPAWWIARLRADYPETWQTLLEAGNVRPPLTLRVNRRKTTRAVFLETLRGAGIAATAVGDDGVIVESPQAVTALPGFDDGWFSVQDAAAQRAAALLDVHDGMRVLDACAAPGGKTTHILEQATVSLLALDSDMMRLSRVEENLKRLRLDGSQAVCRQADAARPGTWWDGQPFDRILADVPCSASGVVRRHPDVKWLRRQSDIAALARAQAAMLEALWPLLVAGGKLLYVTCSLFRAENEETVAAFCARHLEALHEVPTFAADIPHRGGQLLPSGTTTGHNQDGLYYAILHKPA